MTFKRDCAIETFLPGAKHHALTAAADFFQQLPQASRSTASGKARQMARRCARGLSATQKAGTPVRMMLASMLEFTVGLLRGSLRCDGRVGPRRRQSPGDGMTDRVARKVAMRTAPRDGQLFRRGVNLRSARADHPDGIHTLSRRLSDRPSEC